MKTDYKNLKLMEAAAVFLAVIGVSIIGFEVSLTIPNQVRNEIASALMVLDASESAPKDLALADKGIKKMIAAYDVFNKAFIDSVAIPDEMAALKTETMRLVVTGKEISNKVFDVIPTAYASSTQQFSGRQSQELSEPKITDVQHSYPGFKQTLPEIFIPLSLKINLN